MWQNRRESGKTSLPFDDLGEGKENSIEIYGGGSINSVAFLTSGKHVLSGGDEGKIRCWQVDGGGEVGESMDAGSVVCSISVSQDGRWVVSGLGSGWVSVWDSETREQAVDFQGHTNRVQAVDVSPDATQIASGSLDHTACVWSLLTGERLLGPFQHDFTVVAAKFSPDGHLFATATWDSSIRIFDCQNGHFLVDFPIKVASPLNGSLAWDKDSNRLFALSSDANIICLDTFARTTLSKWRVHKRKYANCIALAGNGQFIAACCELTVSFWDTGTRIQVGPAIEHDHTMYSMVISTHNKLAMGGGSTIVLRSLPDILPSHYFDNENISIGAKEISLEDTSQMGISNRVGSTVRELCEELARSKRKANEDRDALKETIASLREELYGQETNSNKKIATLEQTVQDLHRELSAYHRTADQMEECYKETINALHVDLRERDESSKNQIAQLEKAVEQLRTELVNSQRKADNLLQIIHVKSECEALYTEGHVMDAASSLLQILEPLNSEAKADKLIMDWLTEFTKLCITMLEKVGDEASGAGKTDDSVAAYAIALLLTPSVPDAILVKWTSAMLIRVPPCEVLRAATKFKLPKFLIHRTICDILEEAGCFTGAIECFQQMRSQLSLDTDACSRQAQWEFDFRDRCAEKLEKLGDSAMDSADHDQAIRFYSNALSLDPTNLIDILVKRSKGLAILSAWQEALLDVDRVIDLDPSSFRGYERKHATLHAMGHYGEAFEAFVAMLSRLEESPDPLIREFRHKYVDATPAIRKAIAQAIQPMPRVLINTTTGRLYDKVQQAAAFEAHPVYDELRSSMTTVLDYEHIQETVDTFYRYVMLSHRWQPYEPTFQTVKNISVYGLPASPANSKLHRFCDLVRSLQFHWAWSDTCCVDQLDKGVLQESLVAMFKWYRGSSLTIVHLLGVLSGSQEPSYLWKSIWNTRGWTYQEYVASGIVQFYTEDWKPYLGLDMFNHKESHLVLLEMEKAMNYTSQELAALCPGLDRVREKLYLASGRYTTREEDIAYCLFGIFNVAIPVIYGEGDRAVGRLLEHVLTGSGEVTILAWTGCAGSYNSCLPADLTAYNQIVPPHVPQPLGTVEMDNKVMALRSTAADLSLLVSLYQRLHELPSPSVASSRLRLPGIVFPITTLDDISGPHSQTAPRVYRAATFALGVVEIKTRDDLSGMKDLVLIHPWIGPLLDQEFARGTSRLDETTRALQLAVRFRQPFGALLLVPLSRLQYRRVATDSLIMVRVVEEVPLTELTEGIRVVDVQ